MRAGTFGRGLVCNQIVFIDCLGSGRLYAGMTGKRDFLPAFYKMINGISAIK
jgi:hypothetical protein